MIKQAGKSTLKDGAMGERKAVAFVYFWEGVKGQEAEVTMGDLDPKQTERAM